MRPCGLTEGESHRSAARAREDRLRVKLINCSKDQSEEVRRYYSSVRVELTEEKDPHGDLVQNPLFDEEDIFAPEPDSEPAVEPEPVTEPEPEPELSPEPEPEPEPAPEPEPELTTITSEADTGKTSKPRSTTKQPKGRAGKRKALNNKAEADTKEDTKVGPSIAEEPESESVRPETPAPEKRSKRKVSEAISIYEEDPDEETKAPASNKKGRGRKRIMSESETSKKTDSKRKKSKSDHTESVNKDEEKAEKIPEPAEEEEEGEEEDYEVEKVLDKRGSGRNISYLVKWKGWDLEEDLTWEPAKNLANVKNLIEEFEKAAKSKPVKPTSQKKSRKSRDSREVSNEPGEEAEEKGDDDSAVKMCDNCMRIFVSDKSLEDHIKTCGRDEESPPPQKAEPKAKKLESVRCFKCLKEYKEARLLKNHILDHFKPELRSKLPASKPFSCPHCSTAFPDVNKLVTHFAFVHEVNYNKQSVFILYIHT